jgi:hypothetical protein
VSVVSIRVHRIPDAPLEAPEASNIRRMLGFLTSFLRQNVDNNVSS